MNSTSSTLTASDAQDALAVALEHHAELSLSDLQRAQRERRTLTPKELETAERDVRLRAIAELERSHPGVAVAEAEAALSAVLEPRGYTADDPCKPGELERPAFLMDGLFYEGRTHELFGRPGTNKTMLIVWALATVAATGRHALLIEYEMDGNAIGSYLEDMSFDREKLRPYFHQVTPDAPWSAALLAELVEDFPGCAAVALDNVAEAVQSFNGDENAAGDTLKALAPLRDLAHTEGGPAVVTADHLPHARDNASRGTTAKGALSDVAYSVETPHPVRRDAAGDIKLVCRKDRPSLIGNGSEIWFTIGDGQGGLPIARIDTPGKLTDDLSEDGATMIVRLEDYAERNPSNPWLSKEKVYDLCPFAKSRKRDTELERVANDPRQPITRDVVQRGNAAAATRYRFEKVPDDGLTI